MSTDTERAMHSEQPVPQGMSIVPWLVLMLLAGIGFLVSLAYFVVNVLVIFEQKLPADLFGPLAPFVSTLKNISLDYSAVTSGLSTWFCWLIAFNGWRAKSGRLNRSELLNRGETLPFIDNYVTVWVQLGLIGTLWGFMRIGFKMEELAGVSPDPDASAVLKVLLESFGTALLSSLTAVVLAYLVAPLVIRGWRYIFRICLIEDDVSKAVSTLSLHLDESARQVATLTKEVTSLATAIGELSRSLAPGIVENCMERLLRTIDEDTRRICSTVEGQTATVKSSVEGAAERVSTHVANSIKDAQKELVDVSTDIGKRLDEIGRKGDANAKRAADQVKTSTDKILESIKLVSRSVKEEGESTQAAIANEGKYVVDTIRDLGSAFERLSRTGVFSPFRSGEGSRPSNIGERLRRWLGGGRR